MLNSDGDTVFAVYSQGVRIYVADDTTSKASGNKAGFAVGGFSLSKGLTNEFFRVTPDSVRVYINETGTKAGVNRGGFAVGGFSLSKDVTDYYFNIEQSSSPEIIVPAEPRILWYPFKEAFRAGNVLVEGADSVGWNSTATGNESKAVGNYSQAFGNRACASGDFSTAIGIDAYATG
ncbi:MAG: hypothetical protein KJ607_11635, partial [Bacteroidetes bacterium]|nr:hypothetical protein [Bacteroidota bacterium]